MKRQILTVILGSSLVLGAGTAEAQDKMDKYMEHAAPIMHYSCATLVDDTGEDVERMRKVVRLMVAVSLHNRKIDVTTSKFDDEQKKEIKAKFVKMLEDGCANDSDALLAGIVDASVHQLLNAK